MAFGARLKQLRQEKGLKQSELSEVLGVTPATISAYENESRTPDINTASQLADYFDVSVDNLLGRKLMTELDLKNILINQGSMTFGGHELSQHDIDVISRVISAFLEGEND